MLVLAMVAMQGRRQGARRQLMMHHRETAAGLSTINLPLRAKAAGVECLARLKGDQKRRRKRRLTRQFTVHCYAHSPLCGRCTTFPE